MRLNRIVIGVWSVGYRKHCRLISDDRSEGRSGSGQNLYERGRSDQMSAVTPVIVLPPTYFWWISLFSHGQVYICPVTFRSLSSITRMSSDEVQMKISYQCPTSVLLLSDYLTVAPITLLLVMYQHHLCVTNWNVSDQYPTKLVRSEKSTFRPAPGQLLASVEGGASHSYWW